MSHQPPWLFLAQKKNPKSQSMPGVKNRGKNERDSPPGIFREREICADNHESAEKCASPYARFPEKDVVELLLAPLQLRTPIIDTARKKAWKLAPMAIKACLGEVFDWHPKKSKITNIARCKSEMNSAPKRGTMLGQKLEGHLHTILVHSWIL